MIQGLLPISKPELRDALHEAFGSPPIAPSMLNAIERAFEGVEEQAHESGVAWQKTRGESENREALASKIADEIARASAFDGGTNYRWIGCIKIREAVELALLGVTVGAPKGHEAQPLPAEVAAKIPVVPNPNTHGYVTVKSGQVVSMAMSRDEATNFIDHLLAARLGRQSRELTDEILAGVYGGERKADVASTGFGPDWGRFASSEPTTDIAPTKADVDAAMIHYSATHAVDRAPMEAALRPVFRDRVTPLAEALRHALTRHVGEVALPGMPRMPGTCKGCDAARTLLQSTDLPAETSRA